MANDVFANGREVSCKAGSGKSICAFPDVCFTPPQTPATPPGVPIPYPNTGLDSDTTQGTKNVKISGKEVMLKNKSYFKKSTGDEPGCAPKKGVITSVNRGKVYFNAWSMDVKFESENVVRHLDITTHNHASIPGNSPTWPFLDSIAVSPEHPCADDIKKEREKCGPLEVKTPTKSVTRANRKTGLLETRVTGGRLRIAETQKKQCANTPEAIECQNARKCMLTTYDPNRCCPGQTPHHLVEVHGFSADRKAGVNLPQFPDYSENKAPCVCAKCPAGSRFHEEHGDLHAVQGVLELGAMARASPENKGMAWTYGEAREAGIKAHAATFPGAGCSDKCLRQQLDNFHKRVVKVDDSTPLRTGPGDLGTSPSQWQRGIKLLDSLASRNPVLSGA